MNILEQIKIIEKNHIRHFEFFPKNLGFKVNEIQGVKLINCGLGTSMFNIAYGAYKDLSSIKEIRESFTGQAFAWWIPQTQHNPEVTRILLENSFIIETIEHAMIYNLNNPFTSIKKTNLVIKHVSNKLLLEDFITVLEPYDDKVRALYTKINDGLLNSEEKLVVGYCNGNPVTIGILFICENNAGIFSLITNEQYRGRGYGTDMMNFLIKTAKENNCNFVTLSASSDSGYKIYEKLGFNKIGEFECFEYKGE